MAASSAPLSPLPFSLISKPKALRFITSQYSISPFYAPLLAFPSIHSSREGIHYHNSLPKAIPSKPGRSWKIDAVSGNYLLSETNPVDTSQEIVSTGDGGVSTVIQALLVIAFVGLSILTIGVIYIAVTDFLQKREGEKFVKEEAAKKKRSNKKGKVRTRARNGPRGFGQKVEDDDDIDELD